MRFSVIIPVYNVADYLTNCLNSVFKASLSVSAEVEVICVDDGSTDGSGLILDEYCSPCNVAARERLSLNSKFWCRVIHQSNQGASVARNVALEIATGDIVCFVDSDDTVQPCWLVAYADMFSAGSVDVVRLKRELSWLDDGFPWAYALKRDVAKKARFPVGVAMGEDGLYIARLLPHVQKVKMLDVQTYNHLQHEGSAMRRPLTSTERLRYMKELVLIAKEYSQEQRSLLSGKVAEGILFLACRPADFTYASEIRREWMTLRRMGAAQLMGAQRLFVVPYACYALTGLIWPIRYWCLAVRGLVAIKQKLSRAIVKG